MTVCVVDVWTAVYNGRLTEVRLPVASYVYVVRIRGGPTVDGFAASVVRGSPKALYVVSTLRPVASMRVTGRPWAL